jgi:hypothetical protein
MGIEIGLVNPKQKTYPRKCYLKLTCDGSHGFFDNPTQRWESGDFIKDFGAAMAAGWKEVNRSRRMFMCPRCSGKK